MKKQIFICDICGKELDGNNWEDGGRIEISIYQSSQNPLYEVDKQGDYQTAMYNKPDVCYKCVRRVSEAVSKALLNTTTACCNGVEKSE